MSKIEKAVVNGYKKIEKAVVVGYQKIENKFIDKFLKKDNETIEEARVRLQKEQDRLEKGHKKDIETEYKKIVK